jgi:hypothetical protein
MGSWIAAQKIHSRPAWWQVQLYCTDNSYKVSMVGTFCSRDNSHHVISMAGLVVLTTHTSLAWWQVQLYRQLTSGQHGGQWCSNTDAHFQSAWWQVKAGIAVQTTRTRSAWWPVQLCCTDNAHQSRMVEGNLLLYRQYKSDQYGGSHT